MDRTCVSTGRSPETSGPSSLNAPTPNVGDVAEAPPPRTGCPSCTVTQARRASRDGSSSLLESGQRRRLRWGRVESAPLMAGAVALASTGYIAAIDEKAWAGHVGSARASRVPHSVSRHLPTETAREQSTRGARSSHPFGAGAGSQPSCGRRGQAVVRRTVPLRSLDDWLVPACYQ